MALVQAARRLIEEIQGIAPEAEVEVVGEPDGLGFDRSIRFDAATAKKVGETLDVIRDERIEEIVRSSKGVRVTFVADTRADFPTPYQAAEAYAVLTEQTDG